MREGIYSVIKMKLWMVDMCDICKTKCVCEFWEVRDQSRVKVAEKQKANSEPRGSDGRPP